MERNISFENITVVQGGWSNIDGDITFDNVVMGTGQCICDDNEWDDDGGNALVPEARRLADPNVWKRLL